MLHITFPSPEHYCCVSFPILWVGNLLWGKSSPDTGTPRSCLCPWLGHGVRGRHGVPGTLELQPEGGLQCRRR